VSVISVKEVGKKWNRERERPTGQQFHPLHRRVNDVMELHTARLALF
jgi:hypothetical protein